MESGRSRADVNENIETGEPKASDEARKWAGYDPDVVDFIRRCKTVEQAEEVVDYMESHGEITAERAAEIRKQIVEEGLRSFGPKKEMGFYNRDR
jgi:hypothetical protein